MSQKQSSSGGLKGRFNRIKSRVMQTGLVKFMMRVMGEMSKDNGTNMAAGVAYYAFLSLFPLILGLIGLLGLFMSSETVKNEIFSYLSSNLPSAGSLVESSINNAIAFKGALGAVAIIGLLWSGSGIISAISNAINRAWDIPREIPFYLKKPRDILLTVGLGILFILSLSANVIFAVIPVESVPIVGSVLVQIGLRVIAFLLIFIIILILFKATPNTKTYWRHIYPMALITAILFAVGTAVFLYYINNFANYQALYGTIGTVIALLLWIYYGALIIIIGAEMTAEYSRQRRGLRKGAQFPAAIKP